MSKNIIIKEYIDTHILKHKMHVMRAVFVTNDDYKVKKKKKKTKKYKNKMWDKIKNAHFIYLFLYTFFFS